MKKNREIFTELQTVNGGKRDILYVAVYMMFFRVKPTTLNQIDLAKIDDIVFVLDLRV